MKKFLIGSALCLALLFGTLSDATTINRLKSLTYSPAKRNFTYSVSSLEQVKAGITNNVQIAEANICAGNTGIMYTADCINGSEKIYALCYVVSGGGDGFYWEYLGSMSCGPNTN